MIKLNILTEELIISHADNHSKPTKEKQEYIKGLEKKVLEALV